MNILQNIMILSSLLWSFLSAVHTLDVLFCHLPHRHEQLGGN